MPIIFLILLSLPLLEIAVLVAVGSTIGILATLGLVVLTGVLGSILLKLQGASAFSRLQQQLRSGVAPEKELADAAMIMLAGVFLIIPGFVSDVIGLLLFLPPVRRFVISALAKRVQIIHPQANGQDRSGGRVVDLDETDYRSHESGEPSNSPWRRLDGER